MTTPNRWYRRDLCAAADAHEGLSFEEVGFLTRVVDLIMKRDANLPDDESFLTRALGCDTRVLRRLLKRLVGFGKLYRRDGQIGSTYTDVALEKTRTYRAQRAEAGRTSGESRGAKSKENKDLGPDSVHPNKQYNNKKDSSYEESLDARATHARAKGGAKTKPRDETGTRDEDRLLEQAVEVWNEVAKGAMRTTSSFAKPPNRKPRLRKLLIGEFKGDIAKLRAMAEALRATPWCSGDNDRGWKASLDFMIRPDVYARYFDGEFGAPEPRPAKPAAAAHQPRRRMNDDVKDMLLARLKAREEEDRRAANGHDDDDHADKAPDYAAGGPVIDGDCYAIPDEGTVVRFPYAAAGAAC